MANSDVTPFYVETTLGVFRDQDCNNSPVFLVPPVDIGSVGVPFVFNPGAYDADGDSLAFSVVDVLQEPGFPVNSYQYPHIYDSVTSKGLATAADGGPLVYVIDPVSGTITWDAPFFEGEYNLALKVDEYRKVNDEWQHMGFVMRDMQITVVQSSNRPPAIAGPEDVCVVAGEEVTAQIIANDPNGDVIRVQGFGGIFTEDFSPKAWLTPDPALFAPSPYIADFYWQTSCDHVRSQPHQLQFRVIDNPGVHIPQMAQYAFWQIKVVGPAPEGVSATVVQGKSTALRWDRYFCANAESVEIYRRVGSFGFNPNKCQTGLPKDAGYERIASLSPTDSTFFDNNNGEGLAPGASYCYRLLAVFPDRGGESLVSDEVCITAIAEAPVITQVSVLRTDAVEGEIAVGWLPPFDLDTLRYRYEVYRMNAGSRELVGETQALELIDRQVNSLDSSNRYEVVAYDQNDILLDTSASAGMVMPVLREAFREINLTWGAEVPWSNRSQEHPWHYIYRNRTDPDQLNEDRFVLIDSVQVLENGFEYRDNGKALGAELIDGYSYCYWVATQGVYGNAKTRAIEPLINASAFVCAIPVDSIPPCPVVDLQVHNEDGTTDCAAFLDQYACDFDTFSNLVTWGVEDDDTCVRGLQGFAVYYSPTGPMGIWDSVGYTEKLFFVHSGLPGFAGCYRVSAIDQWGNESEWSEPLCRDNCPQYMLPDVFTVNGDGFNEEFTALGDAYWMHTGKNACPRFVKHVLLKVFNRWGQKVYEYDQEISGPKDLDQFIFWKGNDSQGGNLPEGVYYYWLGVDYDALDHDLQNATFKGQVHLVR